MDYHNHRERTYVPMRFKSGFFTYLDGVIARTPSLVTIGTPAQLWMFIVRCTCRTRMYSEIQIGLGGPQAPAASLTIAVDRAESGGIIISKGQMAPRPGREVLSGVDVIDISCI